MRSFRRQGVVVLQGSLILNSAACLFRVEKIQYGHWKLRNFLYNGRKNHALGKGNAVPMREAGIDVRTKECLI